MGKNPEVTIIILNYNGLVQTRACLKSVLATKYPNFKVFLADNGSRINESEILKKEFKNNIINFIRFNKNWGFAKGNNLIIKKVKSKYVVFLNNDTEVKPDWLKELVQVAEGNPEVAVCQPKIKSLKKVNFFEYAGAAGGFIDFLGYPFARGRLFLTVEKDKGQYDEGCDIFWASGTAMFVRKKALDKAGFFDEEFFAYAEEVDLCWRIHKLGLRVVYVPKSCVYHLGGVTSNQNLIQKIFLVHRNHLLLLLKHYPRTKLILILPLRIILDLTSCFWYIIQGRPNFIFSVVAAHVSLILKAGKILKMKDHNEIEKESSYKRLIYGRSIVIDYFILGKKFFKDLNFLC